MNLQEALDRVEASLADVKRQYDLFFQGARRTEPLEERKALEWMVRRLGQRKIPNTSDQFRFNSLQSRFHSLASLWARMTRALEEGHLVRDRGGNLVRPQDAAPEPVDPTHLDRVLEELKAARQECGIPTGDRDVEAMREMLRSRAAEIAGGGGSRRVEFRVTIEEGKPKIKAGLH